MDLKKGKIGIVVLVMFGLIASSILLVQASPYTVEIRVEGTSGLSFSGSYGDLGSQKSVDGTVPKTYTIENPEGDIVSAVFQKQERGGELTVKLVKDGKVVKSESTTAEYGVVSVSYAFKEERGCFIATAAYGTPTAEEIDVLRDFRDNVLNKNLAGETLVNIYYDISPPFADFIAEHNTLRTIVRVGIVEPMVRTLELSEEIWDR
ncbi:MAG: CFI-box-CTERM domain-containing protein [Halobacteriota archaeon]